ncbi:MAG: hypothetical protein KDB24_06065, partial [Microthrixaceae bacterium]|nr:hypothetical protein [Microthrixaceae bacterium]
VVQLVAPAGWGKTTALAQWAHQSDRSVAWVGLDPFHNDPVRLLRQLVSTLQSIEPIPAADRETLWGVGPARLPAVLPILGRTLAFRDRPTVLIFDDVHVLHDAGSRAVIETLIRNIPDGSQIVLAGRAHAPVPLGRLRAAGELTELDAGILSLQLGEAAALLQRSGVTLTPTDVGDLVRSTEGWPAGLALAGLALRQGADPSTFSGRDRLVAEYLREEVLNTLDEADAEFLMRVSALDRFCGSLCDAALDLTGSGRRIESLVTTGNPFMVPLDRTGTWFRFHHLFAEQLAAGLEQRDPGEAAAVRSRASAWYEAEGDLDRAIQLALDAGDRNRASVLIFRRIVHYSMRGQGATLRRLVERLGPDEVAGDARLCLARCWCCIDLADRQGADEFLGMAAAADLGDDPEIAVAVAATATMLGETGWEFPERPADPTRADRPAGGPWWSIADLLQAQALMLTGDPDGALPIFRRCRDALFDLPGLQAFANVFLALLAEDAGQIAQALELVDRARATIDRHGLVDTPILVSVFGAIARVHARHGDRAIAVAAAERAERLLGRIGPTTVRPQLLNQTLLAGAYVALGDHAHADVSIAEARKLAPLMPQAVLLREYLTDAEARRHPVDLRDRPVGVITGAETRVLELLPTHYTLAEIAEMLFVSRSTVKTQVASIYRKLGVTTRSAAVEAASEQKLIGF